MPTSTSVLNWVLGKGSSKAAILFLLIIDQSENSVEFSLLFLANQVVVFPVVLDTSYFHVSPWLAHLQAGQEHGHSL